MTVFVAIGKDARRFNDSRSGSLDFDWLRLRDGEERRVMFLAGEEGFVTYLAHNSRSQNVTTHACLEPTGVACPSCSRKIARRQQTIILLWDIENEYILAWDVPEKHLKAVRNVITEHPNRFKDIAFNLKREGAGRFTSYRITPIPELTAKETAKAEQRKTASIPEPGRLIKYKKPEEIEKMLTSVLH